jgi:putative endonuclease
VTVEGVNCNESAQGHERSGGHGAAAAQHWHRPRVPCDAIAPSVAVVPTDLRHHLGRIGEDLALAHLERLGYTLVARNHRTRYGELDLVVFDGSTLVFVEVKTRRASGSGRGPWEALHERKCRQVRRMGVAFLLEAPERPHSADLRFDAIGVVIDPRGRLVRLDHLEGAF